MPESLPVRLGSIEIVLDDEQPRSRNAGTPVVARCTACGATNRCTIDSLPYLLERRDLVVVADRLSRWHCVSRGHGVPF